MDDQKQQIVEKLKAANNILVTVSASPTVDQLSACIGLTVLLNKMGKHATAVFSGQVPSTIEFLKPQDTIEKTTDSLRDFIIAIDKSKADKLRYKVEDEVVKIFITPYKSSINEKDLIFSQGDFNVDVVIGLGVHQQVDLDSAITAHGRILHDAVVITVNNTPNGELGTIHWQNLSASSMSELVGALAAGLGDNLLDAQISTALLTGIVAETEHFSNKKTTPETMTMSATLLAAGANQQLVAQELSAPKPKAPEVAAKPADPDLLKISHAQATSSAKDAAEGEHKLMGDPNLAVDSSLEELLQEADKAIENHSSAPVIELPKPAELTEEEELPHIGPAKAFGPNMDLPDAAPVPQPDEPSEAAAIDPLAPPTEGVVPPVPSTSTPAVDTDKTLSDIEASVKSAHLEESAPAAPVIVTPTPPVDVAAVEPPTPTPPTDVNDARKAVEDALKQDAGGDTEPLEALNAVPVNLDLGHMPPAPEAAPQPGPGPTGVPDYLQTPEVVQPSDSPVPPSINMPPPQMMPPTSTTLPPQGPPPPPVPPPVPPTNFGNPL